MLAIGGALLYIGLPAEEVDKVTPLDEEPHLSVFLAQALGFVDTSRMAFGYRLQVNAQGVLISSLILSRVAMLFVRKSRLPLFLKDDAIVLWARLWAFAFWYVGTWTQIDNDEDWVWVSFRSDRRPRVVNSRGRGVRRVVGDVQPDQPNQTPPSPDDPNGDDVVPVHETEEVVIPPTDDGDAPRSTTSGSTSIARRRRGQLAVVTSVSAATATVASTGVANVLLGVGGLIVAHAGVIGIAAAGPVGIGVIGVGGLLKLFEPSDE